jgi:hypothetical protein
MFNPHGNLRDVRCEQPATIADPRGPKLCWVHAAAFNNPNREPLHLHKSADGVPK